MKKIIGTCRICGAEEELTFEHIPPASAGNKKPARVYTGKELLNVKYDFNNKKYDFSKLKFINNQRGMGGYYLCKKCNNITGSYYGGEYSKFIKAIYTDYKTISKHEGRFYLGKFINLDFLLISKQILSMFSCVCKNLSNEYPFIKELILNKHSRKECSDFFKIYMYLLSNPITQYGGETILIRKNKPNLKVAYIDSFPVGFVLNLTPKEEIDDLFDITSWLNSENSLNVVEFIIPIKNRKSYIPLV